MEKSDCIYKAYVSILEEELRPAMGCTEPIALAYASARAKELLGCNPKEISVEASGSLIKNVKSVFVPNTGHLKGIEAAVSAGVVAGNASKELEVVADIKPDEIQAISDFLKSTPITIKHINYGHTFDMIITLKADNHYSKVRIADAHTNIILEEVDGKILFEKDASTTDAAVETDRTLLSIKDIYEFANTVDINDVKPILSRQIEYNTAIAEEGLKNNYGANIGSTLLSIDPDSTRTRARAYAAAGSDARMSGCDKPVVINSGSGNQGMTASLPVIVYAKALGVSEEKLYRALTLSNLVTIHEKTPIGRLSAYCGAVSAGAGAGAGIAYLHDESLEVISNTIINDIATISGMVCDGAKASCAAKIAESVDTAILSYHMAKQGTVYETGDGLVKNDVEETINSIGSLAHDGMEGTNDEIIKLMIQ